MFKSAHHLIPRLAIIGVLAVVIGLASIGVAGAAFLPTAITGPVSSVAFTTATVSGDLNPDGATTSWYFQYGTSASYGLKTATENAGAGTSSLGVSAPLAGLTPGVTYHVRLVATNSSGAAVGADASFTTVARPPTVTTDAASSIANASRAVVSGSIIPNGLSTTWYVQYGTSTSYGENTPTKSVGSGTAAVKVSVVVSGLAPHTAYHFQIVATIAAGVRPGGDYSFVTTGAALVVTGSASAVNATSATLSGTVNPDGHSTTWFFQYGVNTNYGSDSSAHVVGAGRANVAVSIGISGLSSGTVYHFRLVATNSAGTTFANDESLATLGPTLVASSGDIIYGQSLRLSGTLPNGAANETVSLYGQQLSSGSFVLLANVLTGAGGMWSYPVDPHVLTSYEAIWENEVSPIATINIEPSVLLRSNSGGRFTVRVVGAHSFSGRLVRLQKEVGSTWRTIASRKLNRSSTTVFQPNLPRGTSHIRAVISAFEAGAGYVAGSSAVHLVRKR